MEKCSSSGFCATKIKAISFLMLAIVAGAYVYQYSRSVDNVYPTRSFSANGRGEAYSVPDIAQITFGVTVANIKTASEAHKNGNQKATKVVEWLKQQGVEGRDIQTATYSVRPEYTQGTCTQASCPPPTITGYAFEEMFAVKIRDMEKLDMIASGVVSQGANTVSNIAFVVDDDSKQKDEARRKAIQDAQKNALSIAQQTGVRMGKMLTISEYAEGGSPQPYNAEAKLAYGMESMSENMIDKANIEPGSQKTVMNVTVTYEIMD